MTDHLTILRDRIEKVRAKVQRYSKSLESAETELSDLATALRVLEGITSGGDSNGVGTSTTMGRQMDILKLLTVGRSNGQSPADLYKSYTLFGAEDITIDTFRTTIWRMKDRVFELEGSEWIVQADGGVYWKEPVDVPPEVAAGSEPDWDWSDLDGDPPF